MLDAIVEECFLSDKFCEEVLSIWIECSHSYDEPRVIDDDLAFTRTGVDIDILDRLCQLYDSTVQFADILHGRNQLILH